MSADSPVAILFDEAGNPIKSVASGSDHCLGAAVVQDIRHSAGNSSVTNLAGGASFTGTAEVVAGFCAVRVSLASDQVIQVVVQQTHDGANWDIEDAWMVYPGIASGRMIKLFGSSLRVVATNIAASTTTYLRLNTCLCPVSEVLPRSLTGSGTVKLVQQTTSAFPDPKDFTDFGVRPALRADLAGSLRVRGPVLTDEASFRDDFTDGALVIALTGVLTFNGIYVSGNATSFLSTVNVGDYVKLDSDGNTALTVVKDVLSDTLLELEEDYLGTPGSGAASRTNWWYQSGNGGSVGYSTSILELISGATPGGHATIFRHGDYLPFSALFTLKLSQRVANQETYVGFMETSVLSAEKMAAVKFSGADNTKIKLVTSFSSDDVEETEITLPNGATTADYHDYRIEMRLSGVSMWVDEVKLATHVRHVPGPYDELSVTAGIANMGPVAGSGTLHVDVLMFGSYNQVDTAVAPRGETVPVVGYRSIIAASTSVTAAAADTQLLGVSLLRAGATIFNDSTALLYLKLGTGASTTSFTVRLGARDYYEVPFSYAGAVHGYWASATGSARITEVI
jgi:hypothetical protein